MTSDCTRFGKVFNGARAASTSPDEATCCYDPDQLAGAKADGDEAVHVYRVLAGAGAGLVLFGAIAVGVCWRRGKEEGGAVLLGAELSTTHADAKIMHWPESENPTDVMDIERGSQGSE